MIAVAVFGLDADEIDAGFVGMEDLAEADFSGVGLEVHDEMAPEQGVIAGLGDIGAADFGDGDDESANRGVSDTR